MSDDTNTENADLMAKIEALQTSVSKLEGKNKELLREKQKIKAQYEDIDREQYAKDMELLQNLQGKVEELELANGNLAKDLESSQTMASAKSTELETYLVDSALTKSLVDVKVKPEFMEAASALLRGQISVSQGESGYSVNLGDKAVGEAIAEWASSDKGKAFVAMSDNIGTGAKESSSTGSIAQPNKAAQEARKNGDLAGFMQASLAN